MSSRLSYALFLLCLFFVSVLNVTSAQSQAKLSDEVQAFNQSVTSKNYKKASEYAYQIASAYYKIQDTGKAISYLNQCVTYAKKAGDLNLTYAGFHLLGTYFLESKTYKKAQENFQNALLTAQTLNNKDLINEELINVSVSYGLMERYKKSVEYAEEALSFALTHQDSSLQQKCYHLLFGFYNKLGNKKKSDQYQAQYDFLVNAQKDEVLRKRRITELEKHIEHVASEKAVTQVKFSEQTKQLRQTHASLEATSASLKNVESSLSATTDSLKEVERISKNRQLEIDLLQKDSELAAIKISEQEIRIENEKLVRNFIGVGSMLSVALIFALTLGYRKKVKANKKIDQQNKNIKSSINYAKRIQDAILPKPEMYHQIFQNSFILFKPRDTVSGDFYWLSGIKGQEAAVGDVAFAAVDCTGHGVPGAFMSLVGINALNRLISQGVDQTNVLLDLLDKEIRMTLQQDTSGNNDGMDVALCIYRRNKNTLEFAGARNSLIFIQDNVLHKIKGETHSVGGNKNKKHFLFTKHEITIDRPTVAYLCSDGYKDQFGGKDNGKFLSKKLHKLFLELHQLPMEEQMNILQTTIDEWKGTREQTDDILVMGLRLDPI